MEELWKNKCEKNVIILYNSWNIFVNVFEKVDDKEVSRNYVKKFIFGKNNGKINMKFKKNYFRKINRWKELEIDNCKIIN